MTVLFIGFVAVVVTIVLTLIARYRSGRAAVCTLGALVVWFTYVAVMAHFGVIQNTAMRPPGIVFVLLPVLAFLVMFIFWALSPAGGRFASAIPLWTIVGTQVFRVGVELFLHRLWIERLVPRMLTFAGANVDIYIGATAPLIAWVATRGRRGLKLALAWNVLGLLALANVVTRAILTAPGPLNLIHAEVPNRMIGAYPFSFIPAFFVPLAVVLHVLAIRSITTRPHR